MGGSEMNGKLGERAASNKRVKIADHYIWVCRVSAPGLLHPRARPAILEAQPRPQALQSSTERPTRNPVGKQGGSETYRLRTPLSQLSRVRRKKGHAAPLRRAATTLSPGIEPGPPDGQSGINTTTVLTQLMIALEGIEPSHFAYETKASQPATERDCSVPVGAVRCTNAADAPTGRRSRISSLGNSCALQLHHGGTYGGTAEGIEPSPSSLEDWRSVQLSYVSQTGSRTPISSSALVCSPLHHPD